MNEFQIQKVIKEAKELRDIRDEYQKTQNLLQEQRWDELQNHITTVMFKHPNEVILHNLVNTCMPNTVEENAVNCMRFLENMFKAKLGMDVDDIAKYLTE